MTSYTEYHKKYAEKQKELRRWNKFNEDERRIIFLALELKENEGLGKNDKISKLINELRDFNTNKEMIKIYK